MKYAILCLSGGETVKIDRSDIFRYCEGWVTAASNVHELKMFTPMLLTFTDRKAAEWFVRRRLTFNPKRTDYTKLRIMNQIMDLNNISHLANKIEFDILEIDE